MTRSAPADSDEPGPPEPARPGEPIGPVTSDADRGTRLARVGLAAALVSRVFSRLVGIVLVSVMAWHAPPETIAVYGYLLGTSTLVIALTDLGVASVGAREVAAGRADASGVLHAAVVPHGLSLALAAALTVLLTTTLGPARVPASALLLTVAVVLVGGFNNLLAELLRGQGRVVLEGCLQMAAAVALVTGGVLVTVHRGSATELLAMVLAKELGLLAVTATLIRPRHCAGVTGRQLVGKSLLLGLAGTVLIGLWRQGMVVTGATAGTGGLATYVVASRYLDAGVALAHIAAVGLRPGLSALAEHPAGMRAAVRRYLGLAAGVGLVVGVVGVVAADRLVSVPFGPRWPAAVEPVQVVALGATPVLVTFVALAALVARQQMRVVGAGSCLGTAVGVLVSVLLLRWQPAAVATLVGTGVGAAVVAGVFLHGLRDLLPGGARPA